MNEWLNRYLSALDVERGYSANTLATYWGILAEFLRLLASNGTKLRSMNREDLRSYVRMLREPRANGARSIRLKLQVVRGFLGYLAEQKAGPRGMALEAADFRYKAKQRQAESMSQSQLSAVLDAAQRKVDGFCENKLSQNSRRLGAGDRNSTPSDIKRSIAASRDLCLLTLLASTGLRISEALGITFSAIDPLDKSIRILGKGKKFRKVFYDLPALEQVLTRYLTERRALSTDHEYLFVSSKAYRPLGPRGVQKALKNYLREAKVSKSVSPHTFRHTFATLAVERGANIKAVSQILGHANCSITINLYTHLSNEHLREVMQLCSPLSNVEVPLAERIRMRKQHLAYIEKTG